MKVKSESEVIQLCLAPSDPMDCSLPGSSVHGIFQAKVPEWVAIAFSESVIYNMAKDEKEEGQIKDFIHGNLIFSVQFQVFQAMKPFYKVIWNYISDTVCDMSQSQIDGINSILKTQTNLFTFFLRK